MAVCPSEFTVSRLQLGRKNLPSLPGVPDLGRLVGRGEGWAVKRLGCVACLCEDRPHMVARSLTLPKNRSLAWGGVPRLGRGSRVEPSFKVLVARFPSASWKPCFSRSPFLASTLTAHDFCIGLVESAHAICNDVSVLSGFIPRPSEGHIVAGEYPTLRAKPKKSVSLAIHLERVLVPSPRISTFTRRAIFVL